MAVKFSQFLAESLTSPSFLVGYNSSTNQNVKVSYADLLAALGGGGIGGSGTTNYISKWTGANSLGNSQIFDNGSGIGINTASPLSGYNVTIQGTSTSRGIILTGEGRAGGTSTTAGGIIRMYFNSSTNNQIEFASPAQATSMIIYPKDNTGAMIYATGGVGEMYLGNDGSGFGRINIKANGNILIGTTTDAGYKLDVNGLSRINTFTFLYDGANSYITSLLSFNLWLKPGVAGGNIIFANYAQQGWGSFSDNGFNSSKGAIINSTGVDSDTQIKGDNDANLLYADASTDRIGIGTATPAFKLDVNGTGRIITNTQPQFTIESTTVETRLYLNNPSSYGATIRYNTTGAVGFGLFDVTGSALRFFINDAGYVGVGAGTSVAQLFQVGNGLATGTQYARFAHAACDILIGQSGGTLFNFATNTAGFVISNQSSFPFGFGTIVNQPIFFGTNNVERARFFANGNFGIGTTTDAGFKLDVNGTARIQGNVTTTSSFITPNSFTAGGSFGVRTNSISIGDGTESVDNQIRFSSGGVASFNFFQTGGGSATISVGGGAGTCRMEFSALSGYLFRSNNVEVLRIINEITFNEVGSNIDFRIEGDTNANLFFLDASVDNIGMGTNTPNASALLDISSTTKGFLPPRMTGAQAEAIASPAVGLMVFSTDGSGTTITSSGWWGYTSAGWVKIG